MRIAIAIVNYNGASYIGDCLASLNALTAPPASVLVFDNASTDDSLAIARRLRPDARIIRSRENVGFTGGVNACMRACLEDGFDALLLLNPDASVEPGLLARLSDASARHPGAILAAAVCFRDRPDVLSTHAGEVSWWRGRSNARLRGRRRGSVADGEQRVEAASGCCLLIPADAIRRIGLFDDHYFLYFEDLDYLERASRASVHIWHVPSALAWHVESAATGGRGTPFATYYFARNRHYFVRKFRRGCVTYPVFLAYELADASARFVGFCLTGRGATARALVRGVFHGWIGRMGAVQTQLGTDTIAVSSNL